MQRIIIILMSIFVGIWLHGCANNPAEPPDDLQAKLTCMECHIDQEKLMALAAPEPEPSGESGEG